LGGAMKKILLVDDEKEFLYIVENSLKEAGFDVVTATNGRDALRSAKEQIPDLVILDIVLPDIDGETIYKKLKEDPETSRVPVIFISGVYTREDADRQSHFLYDKLFLTKPFEENELIDKIKTAI
jgi:CheY-like chemotaxis protein